MSASRNDTGTQRRSRTMKRTFILLPSDDTLEVPKATELRALESSGRIKEIEFTNNSTSQAIGEMLVNSFSNKLRASDLPRLNVYKAIGNQKILTPAGGSHLMCGDTLKAMFGCRTRAYLQLGNTGTQTHGVSDNRPPVQDADSSDSQESIEQESSNESGSEDVGDQESIGSKSDYQDVDDQESVEEESSQQDNSLEVMGSNEGNRDGSDMNHEVVDLELSGDESDNGLWRSVFASTPSTSGLQRNYKESQDEEEAFVSKLYDAVVVAGARADKAVSDRATEVGTIKEVEDHLIAAETNPRNGPAHDTALFVSFIKEYDIPQKLALLCLNAKEMKLQSHQECRPLVFVRYKLNYHMVEIIRSIMQSESCLTWLSHCNIHVTHMESKFDVEACGNLFKRTNRDDVQMIFLQPTMSGQRMVIGNILTGNEGDFVAAIEAAVEEACQAGEALRAQRQLLEDTRNLKKRQEEEYRLSEQEEQDDKAKEDSDNGEGDATIQDSEEVEEMRRKRVAALAGSSGEHSTGNSCKRKRTEEEENERNDSGTVSLKETI